jgi:hypothetical protein
MFAEDRPKAHDFMCIVEVKKHKEAGKTLVKQKHFDKALEQYEDVSRNTLLTSK